VSDRLKQLDQKKVVLIFGVSLILTSILLSVFSIVAAITLNSERRAYLDQENITMEVISVPLDDGIVIKGLLYADKEDFTKIDGSVPTVLIIHGINGKKEYHFSKAFQLVKMGYAVVSVEQRGHGESGGFVAFLGKEPTDMVQVIDYIVANFKFSNSSNLGLLAFSYGGGVASVLQAIEPRIHACVLYHPMASVDNITNKIPFQNLIGKTPGIPDVEAIQDGFDVSNTTNTKNLLLLHGADDDLILPQDSQALHDQVGGATRDDVDIEIRPGLKHGQNEGNTVSLKHTLVWLEHFFHNASINITNREDEINYMEIIGNQYPGNSISEELIWYSAIMMFFGLVLILVPSKLLPISKENQPFSKEEKREAKNRDSKAYQKMLLTRTAAYIAPVAVGGLICALLNPSMIYGYFIFIPIATIVLLLFIPRLDYSDWRSEWISWKENKLDLLLYSVPIILIPVVFFGAIYNINAIIMVSSPLPLFNLTTISYSTLIIASVMMDYLLLRGWKFKHTFLLIGLRPLTLFIFFLFVPIPEFTYLGGIIIHVLFLSLIGIVFWILLIINEIFSYVFKNKVAIILIIALPLIVFLVDRFFRIM